MPGRALPARARGARAEGTILIVTLWIILALVGLLLTLARAMRVEAQCSANGVSAAQAAAVEQGAVQYVLSRLATLDGEVPDEANTPCQAVRVGSGAFWVLRCDGDGQNYSYGITDEASKVNLNTASLDMLSMLPNMTADLAASIADWRDADDTITPGGAESEYYLMLEEPYEAKNAPLETVGELGLLKEMTPDVAIWEDTNRNGFLDENENDGAVLDPNDNSDGHLDRGPYAFSTVYSAEPAAGASGTPAVDVNTASREALTNAFRNALSPDRLAIIVDRVALNRPFTNIIDFYAKCGLTMDEFRLLIDSVTVGPATSGPSSGPTNGPAGAGLARGKINVNTAPREVLACLGQLTETDVQALLDWRADASHDLSTIAWIIEALPKTNGAPAKAVAIGGLITTRTYQFSADIVALSGDGRAFRRCRIVVDLASSLTPRVVYWQDLTGLGWPLDAAIIDQLRAGAAMDKVLQESGQKVK